MDLFGGHFHERGYVVIDDVVGAEELDEIVRNVDGIADTRAGTRRMVDLPWCRPLACRLARDARLARTLPLDARLTRLPGKLAWPSLRP